MKRIVVHALGACHPDCPWCARAFWHWYAYDRPGVRGSTDRSGPGSFAAAAATSIRPPR